jgi:hypothetical protein
MQGLEGKWACGQPCTALHLMLHAPAHVEVVHISMRCMTCMADVSTCDCQCPCSDAAALEAGGIPGGCPPGDPGGRAIMQKCMQLWLAMTALRHPLPSLRIASYPPPPTPTTPKNMHMHCCCGAAGARKLVRAR